MHRSVSTLLSVAAFCAATSAQASIIGGEVTGGYSFNNGGTFVQLFPSATNPLTVGLDNYQDLNLNAFNEDQNIEMLTDIALDIGSLSAGDIVASHYVGYDPAGSTVRRQIGYVDFDAAIYGVATSRTVLDGTDFLANTNVTYLSDNLRGLESGDTVWIDAEKDYRIWVDWAASTPGDYIRVFTQESPLANVPLPASSLLLLAGLGGLAAMRRRR